jgi:saccharopine dehydrogenase (NAD+, L-lysine-forming)
MTVRLWMRHEVRPTECRAPIAPADARPLVQDGFAVTVEDSPQRIFPSSEYAAVGCRIVAPGTWVDAPVDTYVIGLKELPDEPAVLRHRHVFFGHAYKGQPGAARLLRRFVGGGGTLLDLEYLTDDRGRRLAAFGLWAGYVGAALAVLHHRGRLDPPLRPLSRQALDAMLAPPPGALPTALVLGALGRSGRGAVNALEVAGITATRWDVEETRELDRAALLDHDILVNTVLASEPIPPFLTQADLDDPARRLTVVCDVTCDVGSECNTLPIYDSTTSWLEPARRLRSGAAPLDIIAIDNLPSLLPREASVAFSADLLPQLRTLGGPASSWQRCERLFLAATTTEDVDA